MHAEYASCRESDGTQRQQTLSNNAFVTLIGLYIDVDQRSYGVVDPGNDLKFVCARNRDSFNAEEDWNRKTAATINSLEEDFDRSLTLAEKDNASFDCRTPRGIKIETWYWPWFFSTKPPHTLLKSRETQTAKSLLATMAQMLDEADENTTPQQMDETIKDYLRRDESDQRISAREFFCGNPNVEVIHGIVHLYRENVRVPVSSGRSSAGERSDILCMLNVPAKFNCPDLLHFVAPFGDSLQYVRILNIGYEENSEAGGSSTYLVLLKFKTHDAADRFYELTNGIPYTSLEQTSRCQLAYVARIDFTPSAARAGQDAHETNHKQIFPFSSSTGVSNSSFTELPMCIVCLERMDEAVDGIVTILCNHSFHSSCLARGAVLTCPVCRYVSTPQQHEHQTCMQCEMEADLWICLICGNVGCGRYSNGGHAVSHWIATSHTYAMNIDTRRVWDYAGDNYVHRLVQGDGSPTKPIAVDGGAAGMADYEKSFTCVNTGDTYNNDGNGGQYVHSEEQKDSINLEFHYVLSRSLEEQRAFFEKKEEETAEINITRISKLEQLLNESSIQCRHLTQQCADHRKERDEFEKRQQQISAQHKVMNDALESEKHLNAELLSKQKEDQYKCEKLQKELSDLRNALENQSAELRRERESFEKRVKKLNEQLQTTTKALSDEKQLSDILSLNQKECKEDCDKLRSQMEIFTTQKDAEINELQEQIRDLMFHFQSQAEISTLDESQREEIQEGHMEVGSAAAGANARGRGSATKTKRRR